jgi:putative oxidoreductase
MFANLVLLLSRCLLAPIMLVYGWDKLLNIDEFINNPATKRFMEAFANGSIAPLWFAYANALMQFGLGLAVLLGLKTRFSAALLALWMIPVSYFGHPFWAGINPVYNEENFYKNLGIIAAYLMISCYGGGKYSVDAIRFGK